LINFFYEEIDFSLSNPKLIEDWVTQTIISENFELGDINYIFCNDSYLHNVNVEYLKHDTYTDIITFDYCEETVVNSDIFISIERVKENAKSYSKSFENELERVLIHGVLHLLGYKDKSEEEVKLMRSKEDFYLTLLAK